MLHRFDVAVLDELVLVSHTEQNWRFRQELPPGPRSIIAIASAAVVALNDAGHLIRSIRETGETGPGAPLLKIDTIMERR